MSPTPTQRFTKDSRNSFKTFPADISPEGGKTSVSAESWKMGIFLKTDVILHMVRNWLRYHSLHCNAVTQSAENNRVHPRYNGQNLAV
jgi:hypothetical protein